MDINNVIEPQEWEEIDESLFERQAIENIDYKYIFGLPLSDHVEKVAKASSCSKEYILMNLLILSSAIIGNKKTVAIWPGWTEPVHLWGILVGSPSCRKTASMALFYRGLEPLMKRRQEEYEIKKTIYLDRVKSIKNDEENKEIIKEKIESLRKPILRQIIVNDATIESICKAIDEKRPECICLFRDEFTGFIKGLEKYNNSDKSFFTEGYCGHSYTINRVKNEEPKYISKLSISILGGIQPDKLLPLLKDADDGFISRFLFVSSNPQNLEVLDAKSFYLDEELFKKIFNELDMQLESTIVLSIEAFETFKEWCANHDLKKRYVSGLLESSYGKFHGQLIRLACVLEHILRAVGGLEPPTEISNDTLRKAIYLIEYYFKPTAAKIFCECVDFGKDIQPIRKFIKYLIDNNLSHFNWREITRGPFKELRCKKDIIISKLINANIIRESSSMRGRGQPKSDYLVNPKVNELKL
jgi:hypothetical protein